MDDENFFDGKSINQESFSVRDLLGQDKWEDRWTVSYSFVTATGLTVVGRYRIVGRQCFFQVRSSGTSLETTAGTSYITLPIAAKGYGGQVTMFNATTNVSVGTGGIDVTNSRAHLPSQAASGDTFTFSGWYEI